MLKSPNDVPDRLRFAGEQIFGKKCWRGRLATGLGVSRATMRLWLNGEYKSQRDIDGEILDLIDRERAAHAERRVELGHLRKRILSSKRERRDAL